MSDMQAKQRKSVQFINNVSHKNRTVFYDVPWWLWNINNYFVLLLRENEHNADAWQGISYSR